VEPKLAGEYVKKVSGLIDLFEISASAGNKVHAVRMNIKPELFRQKLPKDIAEAALADFQAQIDGVPYLEGFNLDSTREIRKVPPKAALAAVGGLLLPSFLSGY
jgi:hypothetical protein